MRRAGGNPLYAREFVHMLEDRARDGQAERDRRPGPAYGCPTRCRPAMAARTRLSWNHLETSRSCRPPRWSAIASGRGCSAALDRPDPTSTWFTREKLQRTAGHDDPSPPCSVDPRSTTEFAFTHGLDPRCRRRPARRGPPAPGCAWP